MDQILRKGRNFFKSIVPLNLNNSNVLPSIVYHTLSVHPEKKRKYCIMCRKHKVSTVCLHSSCIANQPFLCEGVCAIKYHNNIQINSQ